MKHVVLCPQLDILTSFLRFNKILNNTVIPYDNLAKTAGLTK